jgi:hypothetical protein
MRVFENRVLRRIFGPERDEVTVEWRRLHKKELYAVRSSPDNIRMTKSKTLRWAGHVASISERRGAYRNLVGNLRAEDRSVDVRIILKWMFEKWDGGMDWIDQAQDRSR